MKKKLVASETYEPKRRKFTCCYDLFFPQWPKVSNQSSVVIIDKLSKLIALSIKEISLKKAQDQHKQSSFVIGLQEVTKAVKRDQVEFVLVAETQDPPLLFTQHLLVLCIEKKIPVASVERLSNRISNLLRIRSVLAIAIMKNCFPNNRSDIDKIKSRLKLPCSPDSCDSRPLTELKQQASLKKNQQIKAK